MTDEPDKSTVPATPSPQPVQADAAVGDGDAALSSAPATGAEPPIDAGPPASSPDQASAQVPGDQTGPAESPAEPVEAATPEAAVEQAAPEPGADADVLPAAAATQGEGDQAPSPAEPEAPTAESAPQEQAAEPAPKTPPEEGESSQAQVPEQKEEEEDQKEEEEKSENMDWYILKVQSNREDSIREGLLRRVAIAGLGTYFGEVIVPMEQVTEFKAGKKRVTKRKLYPGYLVVQMEINDDTWFLVRETPGIGDFTGAAGHPTPMQPHEVARILATHDEKDEEAPKLKIAFRPGDRVKINEGTFENFEGEVDTIDETNGRVTVMINIFGRSTPVELEYWQIESV